MEIWLRVVPSSARKFIVMANIMSISGHTSTTGVSIHIPLVLQLNIPKVRAQFELLMFDDTNVDCPPDVLVGSSRGVNLSTLHSEVESARATGQFFNWRVFRIIFPVYATSEPV